MGKESDYQLLKRYGHSPIQAATIVFDAKRGDDYSIKWIGIVREHFRNKDIFRAALSPQPKDQSHG